MYDYELDDRHFYNVTLIQLISDCSTAGKAALQTMSIISIFMLLSIIPSGSNIDMICMLLSICSVEILSGI